MVVFFTKTKVKLRKDKLHKYFKSSNMTMLPPYSHHRKDLLKCTFGGVATPLTIDTFTRFLYIWQAKDKKIKVKNIRHH